MCFLRVNDRVNHGDVGYTCKVSHVAYSAYGHVAYSVCAEFSSLMRDLMVELVTGS